MQPEQQSWEALKRRLAESKFRSRFRLKETERRIYAEKGPEEIKHHCREILSKRIAPAFPFRDGKQTPMKGHPCFVAQHATGMCCRKCLQKWHGIQPGRALTESELDVLTDLLMCWIRDQISKAETIPPHTPDLFRG